VRARDLRASASSKTAEKSLVPIAESGKHPRRKLARDDSEIGMVSKSNTPRRKSKSAFAKVTRAIGRMLSPRVRDHHQHTECEAMDRSSDRRTRAAIIDRLPRLPGDDDDDEEAYGYEEEEEEDSQSSESRSRRKDPFGLASGGTDATVTPSDLDSFSDIGSLSRSKKVNFGSIRIQVMTCNRPTTTTTTPLFVPVGARALYMTWADRSFRHKSCNTTMESRGCPWTWRRRATWSCDDSYRTMK
jgi:hypothetical protein